MAEARLAAIQGRLDARDPAGATSLADTMLADASLAASDRLAALVLRARAREALADLPHAIDDMVSALAIDPTRHRLWNELGILHADAGEVDRAMAAFERAVSIEPTYARAWNNLGNAQRSAGDIESAIRSVERAVQADPAYVLGWSNLGALRLDTGDDAGAESALRRALAIDANHHQSLVAIAGVLRRRGDLDAAESHLSRAVARDPRDANALLQLAGTLSERDALDAARSTYAQAAACDPKMLRALFGRWLTLPMVPASATEVAAARAAFADGLTEVARLAHAHATAMAPGRLLDELRWSNFLLAYQGGDDRALQERYAGLVAELLQRKAPQWQVPIARRTAGRGRIRIGFISTFFRDGTVGRYFERWITQLPREDFDVHVYNVAPGFDEVARRISQRADRFFPCPWWQPSRLAPKVKADALDVVVYPELGMGAIPFALAALRLAPLQCVAWGHPVTTGHATIDVYFSCAAMEPADGAVHYTERLVTLPGLGTCYRTPEVPRDATRARFGLPDGVPLLLCPQSLFKVHPDNDALFARVLAAVPDALLVGFEGRDPRLTARYAARLAAAGIAPGRVRLLPHCGHEDYLRVNTLCDLMLDTLHWSGGNTSLDALACGLPLVTLPGRFMRGRQSTGMLRLMGIDACVARDEDDYVRIAAELAQDRARRDELSRAIVAAGPRIFDDAAPVAAVAQWLRDNA